MGVPRGRHRLRSHRHDVPPGIGGLSAHRLIAPVIASYVIAFTLLFLCLAEGMPVGVAYGIWSATGVALTAVLAKILFDEPFTWLMGLGVVAIAGGVLLIEIGAS